MALQAESCAAPNLLFDRRDINHKAVLYIALRQPFIGLVNILNLYQFNVGSDAVVGAEIQHLLSFANTSDGRTSQTVSPYYQIEGSHWSGFFRRAHQRHGAILLKERKVSIEVMVGGNCIQDEVETGGVFLHLLRVGGNDH